MKRLSIKKKGGKQIMVKVALQTKIYKNIIAPFGFWLLVYRKL